MKPLWSTIKTVERTPEQKFRLDKQIEEHLMTCLRSSECFNYLGSICFKHKKITVEEYEMWWKWWEKNKQRIIRPPKDNDPDNLLVQAQETFMQPPATPKTQEELDKELQIKLGEIPF